MTITTDTTTLPPLTEAMTARDLYQHEEDLRVVLGGRADVVTRARSDGVHISLYPGGIGSPGYSERAGHADGDTWPEAFAAARAWIANHATVHRGNRIRAMALAIIDLTDQHGRCDRAMLTRRDFSGAEVDDLRDAACQRASEMSANSPFRVED